MTAKKLISMAGRRIKDSRTSEAESCGGGGVNSTPGKAKRSESGAGRGAGPGVRGAASAPARRGRGRQIGLLAGTNCNNGRVNWEVGGGRGTERGEQERNFGGNW